MEEKQVKKNNQKFILIIAILGVIILGMGIYIAYDKGVIFKSIEKEEKNSKKRKKKINVDSKVEDQNEQEEIKALDLSKCLNSNQNTYTNPKDTENDYGLSMQINSNQTSITLSINWQKFGPISNTSTYAPTTETYQITNFSKKINSVFVGDFGQDATGITLFYLMEDKTVEYTPILNQKVDKMNHSYYEINYSYDEHSGNPYFSTKGTISGVNDVIKLYTVNVTSGVSSWITTIGAKKDGSFYDLGSILHY